jgi:nucleotide-binding universal stress UspA family protein
MTSLSTVVVGVDGSSSALDAVAFAAREAQLRKMPLRLVQAFVWPLLDVADGAGPGVPGLRANADAQLAAAHAMARQTAPGVEVDTQLISGWPVPVLAQSSTESELVVIGSHGCGRVVAGLVGSTAIELAATSHAPLVVIRPSDGSPPASAEDAPILAGVDGSPASIVGARFAAREADLVGAPLHVVQVQPNPRDEIAARALVDQLHKSDPQLEIEFRALAGHAAGELVKAATYARMVVVGTRGRSGIVGLILGSVSHALLEHATCPIAVMPRRYVKDVTSSPHWSTPSQHRVSAS